MTIDFSEGVKLERERQEKKWGEQNHFDSIWLAILTEEVGEVAKAILEHENIQYELVQVAAVAQAWAESIERNGECICRLCHP